ncbi:MAG: NAD-dependent epimerase/dehydratase family protein [Thermoanaerobaculia bacterium]
MEDGKPWAALSGRRILVTGATGFIGANLIRVLAEAGLRCRALVRPGSRREILAPWAESVELVVGDARDLASLLAACEGIEVCLHAAGSNDMSLTQPELRQILVPATSNVLEACNRQGVRKVVSISSCETLGASASPGQLMTERASYDPGNDGLLFAAPYHEVEEIVAGHVARGLDVSLVNLLYVMAPGDRGQLFDGILRMGWLGVALGGGFSLSLIDGVVDALLTAAVRGGPGERYMVAGENVTYQAFTRGLRRAAGRNGPVLRVPDALARAVARLPVVPRQTREVLNYAGKYLYYDCGKARDVLGYQVPPLERVIEEVLHGTPRIPPRAHRKAA